MYIAAGYKLTHMYIYLYLGFIHDLFLGGWGGGEDCMGVVGVGRVKHVLPRGVWGHAPPGKF